MTHTIVRSNIESWLVGRWTSQEHKECTARISRTQDRSISPPDEVAMMVSLIEHFKPRAVLEIGTYFAGTSRFLAEALESNGTGELITIDPFGEERVPGLIRKWPKPLQDVTKFISQFSMEYFAKQQAPSPKNRIQFGLVFVDGNHKFEYALFDICSAAYHLAPGGTIFVDNLEQEGPRLAAAQFLRMNPAWKLFQGGRIIPASEIAPSLSWGVLLAPEYLQIGGMGYQYLGKSSENLKLRGLVLNLVSGGPEAVVTVNFVYIARPLDLHITGHGTMTVSRSGTVSTKSSKERAKIIWDAPALFVLEEGLKFNFTYRVEISVEDDPTKYILLDSNTPFELLTSVAD